MTKGGQPKWARRLRVSFDIPWTDSGEITPGREPLSVNSVRQRGQHNRSRCTTRLGEKSDGERRRKRGRFLWLINHKSLYNKCRDKLHSGFQSRRDYQSDTTYGRGDHLLGHRHGTDMAPRRVRVHRRLCSGRRGIKAKYTVRSFVAKVHLS